MGLKVLIGTRPSSAMIVGMLALVLALSGTAIAFDPTKANVKRVAKKQAKAVFNSMIGGATAGNADSLGGSPATDYAKKTDLPAAGVRADGNIETLPIDNFTSVAFTSIVSKDLTAPSPGFLFLVGNVSAEDDIDIDGENQLSARLRLDGQGITEQVGGYESSSGAANDNGGNTASMSAVVPVTAGAHTVHLDARELGFGSFIRNRDISALFVPTGSGVTPPVGTRRSSGDN